MEIIASNKGIQRELIEPGNYPARCYQMIHIGNVVEIYMGKEKTVDKILIGWELPSELKVFNKDKGEQPLVISKDYTLAMNEKANLRKMLASWRGKDFTEEEVKRFNVLNLLGKPCMLNIINRTSKGGSIYNDVGSISPMPKKMECPVQINPNLVLAYDEFDWNVYESLPDWIKTKIKSSDQFAKIQQPQHSVLTGNGTDIEEDDSAADDLPF